MYRNLLHRLGRGSQLMSKPQQAQCRACGAAVERHSFVCEAESCQMQALAEQAMLGSLPVHLPRKTRRVRFHAAPALAYGPTRLVF